MTSLDHTPQIAECAQRLEALAQRWSSFMEEQSTQLDELVRSTERSAATGLELSDELREEKAAWQRQKAVEETRIQEQVEHLTKAWQELEVEQRRLMMLGTAAPAPSPQQPAPPQQPAETVQVREEQTTDSLDLVDSMPRQGETSAAIQFQRLKREIRHHSQRRR